MNNMNQLKEELNSNDVVKNLVVFKEKYINSDNFQFWIKNCEEAKVRYHEILTESNFKDGGTLTAENLNEMFRLLKRYSANRSLSRLIYEENGIEVFNNKLRNLYYGEATLPKRIDEFLILGKIGGQSLSQFLVIFDDKQFPLITYQNRKVLNLDTDIEEIAKKK